MKIYNYRNTDGLYLSESLADPDPLEIGNWLIPAFATIIEPPVAQNGKTIHFQNNNWVYQDIPTEQATIDIPLTYQEKRRQEYPSFLDYLDGIVKGDIAQQQAYINACLTVKQKYPKE